MSQAEVYDFLLAHGPATVVEIAEGIGNSRPNAHRCLMALRRTKDVKVEYRKRKGFWSVA